MDDEIDLLKYVEILLRHWIWIVAPAVVLAAATFIYFSLQPTRYRASSMVVVKDAPYNIQFDSRIRTEGDSPSAYRAFPTLATSDGVLQGVVERLDEASASSSVGRNPRDLSRMVSAESDEDARLIVLTVRAGSGADAIALANSWADAFVAQANAIYGQGDEDVAFFQTQMAQAEQALSEAEANLIEYEARNEGTILRGQLDSLIQTQADYLTTQRQITYLVQDIEALQAQLRDQSDSHTASLADGLTVLLLQLKAFDGDALVPIQLQVEPGQDLADASSDQQVAFLTSLAETLQAKSSEVEAKLAELTPQILAWQQKVQESTSERDRLVNAKQIAGETYLTLSRKLEEARIAAQEEEGVLKVGSYAVPPASKVGSRQQMGTIAAAILGAGLGIVAVFSIEYVRNRKAETNTGNPK